MYVKLARVPANHIHLCYNAIHAMHHIVFDHLADEAAAFGEVSEVVEGFRDIQTCLDPANSMVVEESIQKLILAHLLYAEEGQQLHRYPKRRPQLSARLFRSRERNLSILRGTFIIGGMKQLFWLVWFRFLSLSLGGLRCRFV